jgi:phosphate uptake regulator
METRKVQIIGGSTFIVSLPKKWALENKLKHGDTMFLSPQIDGTLVLRPEKRQEDSVQRVTKKRIDAA